MEGPRRQPYDFRTEHRIPLGRFLGGVLVLVLCSVVCDAAFYLSGLSWRGFLIAADATVILLPIATQRLRGRFDLFDPLLMADFSMIGMYVGRPLADILTGHFHEHSYDISAGYNEALFLVLCGSLALQLGYFSPIGPLVINKLPRPSTQFHAGIAVAWAFTIGVVGLGLYVVFLSSKGGILFLLQQLAGVQADSSGDQFASQSAYFYNGVAFLVPASTLLLAVWLKTGQRAYLFLSLFVMSPYLSLQIAKGTRSAIIGVLFGLPVLWYTARRKRPNLAFLLVGSLTVMFFFSVLREFRNVEGRRKMQTTKSASPVETILQLFTTDDDEMFDVIAQEMVTVPKWVPFRPFGSVEDIFIRAVPRVLWKDKPIELDENFFATMEPGRYSLSRAGTAPSMIGTLYLDSSYFSVFIGMFLIGAVLRAIWHWFLSNPNSMLMLMIFSTIPAAILADMRASLPWVFAYGFFTFFPLILFGTIQRISIRITR